MKNKLTKSDLLLAGWHEIYENGYVTWCHPEFDHRVPFVTAKKIQQEMKFEC